MTSPQKILIYRLGSLGDTVIALPCFHLVRKKFPSAEITILTNHTVEAKAAPLTSVLRNTGLMDKVIDYPVSLRNCSEILHLRARLRMEKFDLVVHLAAARGWWRSLRDYLFFRSCGISKIVGIPFFPRDLRVTKNGSELYESESSRLARRMKSLGEIDLSSPASWNLNLTPEETSEEEKILLNGEIAKPFLVVSLGTKNRVNLWTHSNWIKMLTELSSRQPALPIVVIGAQSEAESVDNCLKQWKGASLNLCGKISPRISAAILQKAKLFIGHDSGPMHLAAAVGTPCVALFSALNPLGQWFPRGNKNTVLTAKKRCAACPTSDCPEINNRCILSISVEEVLSAVELNLKNSSSTAA